MELSEKLRYYFDEMVVYKDLKKANFFSTLSLPSFMRDWLLRKFEDEDGEFDKDEMATFVKQYIPRRNDWNSIMDKIIIDGHYVKFLAKVSIKIDVKTGEIAFALPDFGVGFNDTIIEKDTWENCREHLTKDQETWGMIELGYRPPDNYDYEFKFEFKQNHSHGKASKNGKIKLISFKNFRPYNIDIDEYINIRNEFSIEEWVDILLGAIDYNADGYETMENKLTMLTRLLPFVEKRVNLIELAPKGTGKSYLFGNVSKYSCISSGGVMSRAKMFYDISKNREGLITGYDLLTLDEVQTVSFPDEEEIAGAMKAYLEQGYCVIAGRKIIGESGIVLCGNIRKEIMDADGYSNMFVELPSIFHESALIDRFHGFIKGWNIPRMNDSLKANNWALNSEYFCSIMHELRDNMLYRSIVDDLIIVPVGADTRDTEAVKRIATAYLKLLFPNVQKCEDISVSDFKHYCLDRAMRMRDTIRYQLGLLDIEYRGKDLPMFSIRSY